MKHISLPSGREIPNGGDLVVSSLIEHGAERIFGLPGIQLDPLFDALARQDTLALTAGRHEQAVAYMADGYARATGQPGIGVVVPGPGVLNAMAGLSTAYACRTPVLLICGQIERELVGSGRGALHEIPDQSGVLRSLSRWHGVAMSAQDVPALITEAFAALRAGHGPATLEVPVDVLHQEVLLSDCVEQTRHETPVAVPDVNEAIELIRAARRPLLLAGGGCRGEASEYLAAAAERLGAPVVVTENGKGSIDARHALAFERTAYRPLLETADLVIALGTRFVDAEARDLPTGDATVLVVNTDPGLLERQSESARLLRSDTAVLLQELAEGDQPTHETWNPHELSRIRGLLREERAKIAPQMHYLNVIRRRLPDDGILVGEYTQIGYAASFAYPCRRPRDLIWPGYQGTLGYGFATAIGAAIGNDGPVVCVTGDGGFSWTMEELSTLAREKPPLTTLIFNDDHYGNVRRIQNQHYGGREIASDLTNPDYVLLAQAFGIEAERVASAEELDGALEAAIESGEPRLIEIRVGEFPSPWHLGF